MDKLYSRSSLVIKAVYCILLSPLLTLLSQVISYESVFVYVIATILPIACLYTVPFWLSLAHIKKYRVSGIRKFVLYDSAFCIAPGILGILFTEIINSIVSGKSYSDGFLTIIVSIIFILIAVIFWIMYFSFSRK